MQNVIVRLAAAAFICGLLVSHAARAQNFSEQQQRIRLALERDDSTSAISELKSIQKARPASFTLNNYDYLLARLSQRRGDTVTAATGYQGVVSRGSVVSQYALWHLSEFSRATGNLPLEREHLRHLIAVAPSSLLRTAATIRLGQSFFESGDYPATIATMRQITESKTSSTARSALTLIGQAYLRSGQAQPARNAFDRLISEAPDPSKPDDYALQAARGLDELDGDKQNPDNSAAQQLSESEHLRRAGIYQFNRDFAAARRHYQSLVADSPQSASVAEALYQIGRGLYQEGKYEQAINYFRQVLSQFAADPGARDALGTLAAAQNRLKQTDAAIASYKLFIERFPAAPNPERPYLNIIDALREAGRDNEALEWVQQTRTLFKGQTAATLALFSQARIHFAQGAWSAVLDDVAALQKERDLGNAQTGGATSASEVAFMRAYALEQLGRTGEAVDAYLAIPDGRNEYYGAQATLRLRALSRQSDKQSTLANKLEALRGAAHQALDAGNAERTRVDTQAALRLTDDAVMTRDLLEVARRAYASLPAYNSFPSMSLLPLGRQEMLTDSGSGVGRAGANDEPSHQKIADELLFLGLYDEGAPELAASRIEKLPASEQKPEADNPNAPARASSNTRAQPQSSLVDFDYTLAVYFMRGGNANQALRFALPLWKNVPADYLLELAPRQLVELLYPTPYAPAFLAHAAERGVDPRFLLAIARQESSFRPEAKSAAAARGLMQFISATAGDIASQLGRGSFREEELYDPSIAILFGAQYISNLFKKFPNMPQAVTASYNGGDENVARWVARARSNDPDRYVLEIGFAQTKDYVYRVMSNYRAYQRLYSNQLQPPERAAKTE
ncbi:MAG TPA: transglycosylase SLT domain-containing protein [Pyrinomonadaceae bacterium]|jgi:soluble lytic murein transglycosylase